MKKATILAVIIVCSYVCSAPAEGLSVEKERQLLELLRGWNSENPEVSLSDFFGYEPIKCGTPEMLAIRYYVEHGSPELKAAYETYADPRPDQAAPFWYGSPSGHFKVHYARVGPHAAYGSEGGTEVPDYVKSVAMIMDSVWMFEMDALGFSPPPSDSFYSPDADGRYDIYLVDMVTLGKGELYGYTVPERWTGNKYTYTSYMAMDNDFQEIAAYKDKPLDAARVTAAHEFFHAIQFGYDALEFEDPGYEPARRTHWMEMSAVWMEEQAYDYINDYYFYLPRFYDFVHLSLRTAHMTMHPGLFYQYAAVVWPLYLSQTMGREVVRTIWEKCAEIGGPNVFENAFEDAIVEVSGGAYDFRSALSGFYVWNYFTGARALRGFAFDEAKNYPMIPDSQLIETDDWQPYIQDHNSFPIDIELTAAGYDFLPDYLGANYLRFKPVRLDSTFRFIFHGEERRVWNLERDTVSFDWALRVAGLSVDIDETRLDVDPAIYSNYDTIYVADPWRYSDIIVVLTPFAETRYDNIHLDVSYGYSVIDTTIPITQVTFFDPYPNPLILSEASKVVFEVEQPRTDNIRLDVFTLAGEKVHHDLSSNSRFIDWDGRNENGETVASGMYLVSVRVGDESKIFKVAVIE